MLCWKKASYSLTDKQKKTNNNKNQTVSLTKDSRLKSFRKKSSKDKKNSLTIRFKSNLI